MTKKRNGIGKTLRALKCESNIPARSYFLALLLVKLTNLSLMNRPPVHASEDSSGLLPSEAAEDLQASLPKEEGFVGWTEFVENVTTNVLAEDGSRSTNDSRYEGRKKRLLLEFFGAVSRDKTLAPMAEIDPDTNKPRLFTFCSGTKSESKWQVLNACLLCFSKVYKRISAKSLTADATEEEIAKHEYQPNSVVVALKSLFVMLGKNGIVYSLNHDFNREGGFHAYWTLHWKNTSKV